MHTPDSDRLLLVGRCARAHGVSGEVKIAPETDDPDRLAAIAKLYMGSDPESARPINIESLAVKPFRKGDVTIIAKLNGVDTREAAEAVRGQGLYADLDDLPPLEEGEVFLHDIVGMEVVEEGTHAPLGRVRDVLEGGANLLFAVAREGRAEVLLPDVPAFVREVDAVNRRVVVDVPEGLFD